MIDQIQAAPDSTWDEYWCRCPYATFFHSREWAEIWQAYTAGKMRPAARLITFNDGLQAVVPLSRRSVYHRLATKYFSSPAGTFGGWLALDALTERHIAALVDYLLNGVGSLRWRTNPYANGLNLTDLPYIAKHDPTDALHLAGDFDAIYRQWSKGHRAAARQAMREGVTVRIAAGWDDWQAYYGIYLDSVKRWNETPENIYGLAFFEALYARQSPHIRLWLAQYDGRIVAGALCLYSPQHVAYWHGAALSDYFHVRPVNLLMYEAIKDACERGCAWFDFNPSGELESVRKFKRSFGAEARPSVVVERNTASMKALGYIQSMLAGRRSL